MKAEETYEGPEKDFPKGNPFSVPTGYFEELPESILLRIKGADARPEGFPGATGFEVPDGYFGELPGRIMQKTKRGRILGLNRMAQLAAAAVVILATSLLLYLYQRPANDQIAMDQLNEEEIMQYLDHSGLSFELVAEAYGKMEMQAADSSVQMEQYLLDNIDEQMIQEEL